MTAPAKRPKLPPEPEENVVEIEFGHVFLVFGGLLGAVIITGTLVAVMRDYVRYKRQKALLDVITRFVVTIRNQKGANRLWKEKKTDTLSATRKSNTPGKS